LGEDRVRQLGFADELKMHDRLGWRRREVQEDVAIRRQQAFPSQSLERRTALNSTARTEEVLRPCPAIGIREASEMPPEGVLTALVEVTRCVVRDANTSLLGAFEDGVHAAPSRAALASR
jgi:hypothetical protein